MSYLNTRSRSGSSSSSPRQSNYPNSSNTGVQATAPGNADVVQNTTMPIPLTTTTATTSTITAPHTNGITLQTTTVALKPTLVMPTNRSEWVTTLLYLQKTGRPPLHQTLIDKDDELATALIKAASSSESLLLDQHDAYGQTPLSIAANKGNIQMVQLLLQSGATADKRDDNGRTPLTHAIEAGHKEIAQLLIQHGAGSPAFGNPETTKPDRLHDEEKEYRPNAALEAMFESRNIDALLTYQKQSDRHRLAVFQMLVKHCRSTVGRNTQEFLFELLRFAEPLLTPNLLDTSAVGQLRNHVSQTVFPPKKLSALREEAIKTGNPALLEVAAALHPRLSKLLTREKEKKLRDTDQSLLNRTLVMAIQTGSRVLIDATKRLGAKIDLKDRALDDLQLLGALADADEYTSLKDKLEKSRQNPDVPPFTPYIKTVQGIFNLLKHYQIFKYDRMFLFSLLLRAVQLNSIEAVDQILNNEVKINLQTPILGVDLPMLKSDLAHFALVNNNAEMVKLLLKHGAKISDMDFARARILMPDHSFNSH